MLIRTSFMRLHFYFYLFENVLPETYIRENIIYNIPHRTIISTKQNKKKEQVRTAHLFIESSFTSVSSGRDQYVHTV